MVHADRRGPGRAPVTAADYWWITPMWIAVAAMLICVAAAVLCAIEAYRNGRASAELRAITRAMVRGAAGPVPAPAEDPPTVTMPSVCQAVSLPLDGRPPAAGPRPYLSLPRPGRGRPARHGKP